MKGGDGHLYHNGIIISKNLTSYRPGFENGQTVGIYVDMDKMEMFALVDNEIKLHYQFPSMRLARLYPSISIVQDPDEMELLVFPTIPAEVVNSLDEFSLRN